MLSGFELLLLMLLSPPLLAEISHIPLARNRILLDSVELLQQSSQQQQPTPPPVDLPATPVPPQRCLSLQRYRKMLKDIDDVEDLYVDVPVHIALAERQKKRFVLNLNDTTPLTIRFSAPVVRKMYFNQTGSALRPAAISSGPGVPGDTLVLPCALRGQYDIFVQARQSGALKVDALAQHPHHNWPLLNATHRIAIRTQNRVRKREMIVKWDRSKFDYHAMHYCLVIQRIVPETPRLTFTHFCQAVAAFVDQRPLNPSCSGVSPLDLVWAAPPQRERRLNPRQNLHVVCTGKRRQQMLRRLMPRSSYQLDLFGVHQKRQNLTMRLATTQLRFNRTQPLALRQQALALLKIGGQHGTQIYSFKVPQVDPPVEHPVMRHLLIPCSGSEIRVRLLRQRSEVWQSIPIFSPTYIRQNGVLPGQRYQMRFEPSNDDETLRAQKVMVALSNEALFRTLPELPKNITVFNVRTRCNRATIAWNGSPDERELSYCIIVFNLPQRNRSVVDATNYCMDFSPKQVVQYRNFEWMTCRERQQSPQSIDNIETETILNLKPGSSYLAYVTANLSMGKPLPYQALTLHMASQCLDESHESFY
ncbi:uncharacterized protein Dana_GF11385 [Drosophila ananassae]|uniref:Fibronectin type-III domain-containing protein n=1 Tax=Drosophila ananassae TaxID=7217 RepID=B3MDM2_DROAN|nr:uncharacterized protein LOC6494249 [Drosophila ananassae]EDV37485.1 uncharacterized protein Dana_GF11385 [Drosophila ananassae]